MLSCVGKLLERIIFKHIYNHAHINHLITDHQSGFRPSDSTVNQLSYLYHTICNALDKKKDVQIVFCDISKAFDKVWHRGLLYKLRKFGICGHLLLWFKNYLSQRQQRVVIRGQHSEFDYINAGVPQGSVLGPLLFLIYINDLTDNIKCHIKLFADDTTLYLDFDDPIVAQGSLNDDLKTIQDWAKQWIVQFSPSKTETMACTFKNTPPNLSLYFENTKLTPVEHHKHLGLTLSKNAGWSEHITSILNSVSPMSGVLKLLKYDIDRKSLESIFFTFIRPKLEYACIVWDNCSKKDSDRLESIQLDFARTVTGARKGTSHNALYNETKWPKLSERRQHFKFKQLLKMSNKETPPYLCNLLPEKIGQSRPNSRFPDNYLLPKMRTETFKKSFIPSTITMWNNLTLSKRNFDSITNMCKFEPNDVYYFGNRLLNIKHAQLRMHCSKLNAHLFSLHVVASPGCLCGYVNEDSTHYLFNCPFFKTPREKMLASVASIVPVPTTVDTKLLLYGSDALSKGKLTDIFQAVHCFIEESDRL